MRLMLALISLGLFGAAAAQDYRQWDEEKLREELGRIADAIGRDVDTVVCDAAVEVQADVVHPESESSGSGISLLATHPQR